MSNAYTEPARSFVVTPNRLGYSAFAIEDALINGRSVLPEGTVVVPSRSLPTREQIAEVVETWWNGTDPDGVYAEDVEELKADLSALFQNGADRD